MSDTRRVAFRLARGPRGERLQDRVLAAIREAGDRGLTDAEISRRLGELPDSTRAKRCLLRDEGVIVDSGRRRPGPRRLDMTVWVAVGERIISPEIIECPRCRSTHYIDIPLLAGRGVRRDCARCGAFLDFPVWPEE